MKTGLTYTGAGAGILAVVLGLTVIWYIWDTKPRGLSPLPPNSVPGEIGLASYYNEPQKTASGEQFNPDDLTAAHKKLAFGTRARVTNLESGKTVSVRINDRGPSVEGRIIDLSKKAAEMIGIGENGVARVEVTVEAR